MRIRRTSTVLLAGSLVALTACGGSDGGALSNASFVTKMDGICATARDGFDTIAEPTNDAELATALGKSLTISESAIAEMEALALEGEQGTDRDTIVSLLKQADDHMSDAKTAATTGDQAALASALDDYTATLASMRKAAKGAGLDNCATEPEAAAAPVATDPPVTEPTTTAPPLTLPVTTDAPMASGIEYVDATQVISPWDGQQLVALTEADAQTLIDQITSDPQNAQYITIVGAAQAVDPVTGDGSVLVFVEFASALTPDQSDQFVAGVVGDGVDVAQIDANGLPGYSFTSPDGTFGFVSVRSTTGVVVVSPSQAALAVSVQGLFTANPAL